jgi:hypothetical protein
MLHSAVTSKSDSIPVLLANGVNVLALDSKGKSALQLACLYCVPDTVQLLLNSGAWLHNLGTACMLNATIAGNANTLAMLLKYSAGCNCAITDSGYTLLHAAAAYGRLACAGLLLQHGCDAKALSKGVSTVEAAFAPELTPSLQGRGIERPVWTARRATAMLMLQHGAAYNVRQIAASREYAALVKQYMDGLKQQSAQQLALLQLHAANTCSATIFTTNSSSAGGSSSSDSAKHHNVAKVQLVNADTGEKIGRVYTLNTAVLSRLHRDEAQHDSNVLLNLIASATVDDADAATAASVDIKLLPYNGKAYRYYSIPFERDDVCIAGLYKILQYIVDCPYMQESAFLLRPCVHSCDLQCFYHTGTDFTEQGFDCTIEFLYAAGVKGVTYGALDTDRARATLQAAQHFGLDTLSYRIKKWAEQCGMDIATATFTAATAAAATAATAATAASTADDTMSVSSEEEE